MKIISIGPLKIEDHDNDLTKLVKAALALKARPGSLPVWDVTVKRGNGPRMPTETAFYYALKKLLIAAGFDVIKQVPDKDGHMLSDPYYIRERKKRWCIQDCNAAIRAINVWFNKGYDVPMLLHNWQKETASVK